MLKEYNYKRDFNTTTEPQGIKRRHNKKLSFVVQHHIASRDHYDFRLEWKGVLLSWAIPKGPSFNINDKRLAIQVEDHPLDYKNFEGTIPKGQYGGGTVMIWDEGYWLPHTNVEEGLRDGSLKFSLDGLRLKGSWALIKIKERAPKQSSSKQNHWLLIKHNDGFANNTTSNIDRYVTSIRSNRTMEEIAAGADKTIVRNPFSSVNVQLAELSSTLPKGEDWLFELKYDGYRMVAYIENNKVKLESRNKQDYTHHFAEIASSLINHAKGKAVILDGEITAADSQTGKINFQALQNYNNNPKGKTLTYFIFDILALDGKDLRKMPLHERKNILLHFLQDCPSCLHYSQHFINKGEECFNLACQFGLEGIIAKRINAAYSQKRNNDWLKIKCIKRQEFVIGGYTISKERKVGISSLLLGAYKGDDLIYFGRVGSGFNQQTMSTLENKLATIKSNCSPFKEEVASKANEQLFWVYPQLVAEIKYAEITANNLLRHASFQGLRDDKNVKDVHLESKQQDALSNSQTVNPQYNTVQALDEIRITNPDRIVYSTSSITKQDVAQYYLNIANKILPFIANRVLSVVRCPKGAEDKCFYKKHPQLNSKGIIPITIASENKEGQYFYLKDAIGLLYEVQMGTLEFHTWQSRLPNIETPDIMVFDLDPDENMELSQIRQGVRDLKSVIEQLSLQAFLKTSGNKGYHILIPFNPKLNWSPFYDFAKKIAQIMELQWPDRYTSNMRKNLRKGKIFIDWIRNGRGATSIAPYSLRARKEATVSMPIAWEELDTIAPNSINMRDALYRAKDDDPWKDFFIIQQHFA